MNAPWEDTIRAALAREAASVDLSSAARRLRALDYGAQTERRTAPRRGRRDQPSSGLIRHGRRLRAGLRHGPAGVAVLVSVIIAVGFVGLLDGARHTRSRHSPAAGHVRDASGLIAHLAVLRRPQTPAERRFRIPPVGAQDIVSGLTRRVGSVGRVTFYVVVSADSTYPWTHHDGDEINVVAHAPNGITSENQLIPAAGLGDPNIFGIVGDQVNDEGGTKYLYWVSIVPDGVASARWTVKTASGQQRVVNLAVHDNLVEMPAVDGRPLRATWYAAAGQRVSTDDVLATRDRAANARQRRRDLSLARRAPAASAALLARFTVFSFDRAQGVRLSNGDVVSHPAVSAIPELLLNAMNHAGLDPRQARVLTGASGDSIYIVPGRTRLCLFQPSGLNARLGRGQTDAGTTENCAKASQALPNGVRGSYTGRYVQSYFGVVPKAKSTITIRVLTTQFPGTRLHIVHPVDGLYLLVNHGEGFR